MEFSLDINDINNLTRILKNLILYSKEITIIFDEKIYLIVINNSLTLYVMITWDKYINFKYKIKTRIQYLLQIFKYPEPCKIIINHVNIIIKKWKITYKLIYYDSNDVFILDNDEIHWKINSNKLYEILKHLQNDELNMEFCSNKLFISDNSSIIFEITGKFKEKVLITNLIDFRSIIYFCKSLSLNVNISNDEKKILI